MRRFLALVFVAVAVLAIAGFGGSDRGYSVRAVFDSGSGLRTGMEVRVSGLRVGTVRSIELDQRNPALPRAVAVLDITDRAVANFRADATCAIRSASLLGDRVIDCKPTQTRAADAPEPPPLPGRLLPVTRTSSPVDPDLFLDIFRLPVRQRLSIVINELGTGLAGNGAALRDAVRRADPAFLQLDRVLSTLSSQRRALAQLVRSSDRVLAPLAHEHRHLAGLASHGDRLLRAVALRRASLRETFRRLPAFLDQLRPTLRALDGFSAQAGPALGDLDAAAARLSDATVALRPLAQQGTRGLRALGAAADTQRAALRDATPVLDRLTRLNAPARSVWGDLDDTLSSLRSGGGIERLARTAPALGATLNGFDKYGYYARTNAIITTCTSYAVRRTATCGGTFVQPEATKARSAALLDYLLGGSGG
jgi:phospholipid/cholesterol/gamma-HCH transport system substrate-binding protein